MIPDLKELEQLFKLMAKYQLDNLELPDGTKVRKSLHTVGPEKRLKSSRDPDAEFVQPGELPVNYTPDPDDILFASSSAPPVDLPHWGASSVQVPVTTEVEDP